MSGIKLFLDRARGIVGGEWVLEHPRDLQAYTRDYWPLLVTLEVEEGLTGGLPAAAVLPANEEEVVRLIDAAVEAGVRLVPYAGGTGVLGGAIAVEGEVVLDLARLDWIRWHDSEAGVVDVGAGAPLRRVEEWLQERGWTLRHYPQSYPNALMGGLVATRSTGQYSTGYGGIECRVKGLNAAVPGVGLLRVPPAPRRSLLYPLEQILVGSEGTIAVITRVYLEALPRPECEVPLAYEYASFTDALLDAKALAQRGVAPQLLRVYDELESQAVLGTGSPTMIGVVEGPCTVVEALLEYIDSALRGVNAGSEPAERWLRGRFDVIGMIRELHKAGLAFDTIEVSATWGRLLQVYEAVKDRLAGVEGIVYASAHASHFYASGAALYFTVVFDASRAREAYDAIWDAALRAARDAGGSIGHHHGVGVHRVRWLELEYGPVGVEVLRRIKRSLDPGGVLRDPWRGRWDV